MKLNPMCLTFCFGTLVLAGCSGLDAQAPVLDECSDASVHDPECNEDFDDSSDPSDVSSVGPVCGNGIVEDGEVCDDGNLGLGDYCSHDCQTITGACADGIVQNNEVCDDGNTLDGDYCSSDCMDVTGACGDWVVQSNEACDDGNIHDQDYCRGDCQEITGACGDEVVQDHEACDDGNTVGGDHCSDDCQTVLSVCGDGVVEVLEVCDDGNTVDGDYCSYNCMAVTSVCGDGVVGPGEACDDGNTVAYDYCDFNCLFATGACGDETIQPNETCDDGNTLDDDYCSADCQVVTIFCGDGDVGPGEACDDGNILDDDYCSSDCLAETSICGDDDVGPGEVCEADVLCSTLHPELNSGTARCQSDCRGQDYSECIGMPENMVAVPAGYFWRGCDPEVHEMCSIYESPYAQVYVDAFFIDTYEVSAGDYKECVDAGVCTYVVTPQPDEGTISSDNHEEYHTYDNLDNHPINYVHFYEARTYCEWLGKRLPTEAEWEKAARGTDGRIYPWGNSPAVSCTHVVMRSFDSALTIIGDGCGTRKTWPVDSKPLGISPYGAYQMMGNVMEWVNDWMGYYNSPPEGGWVNPQGPLDGTYHMHRGGSFHAGRYRTFMRDGHLPADMNTEFRHRSYGFRCAL